MTDDKPEQKKNCCAIHSMYDTLSCEKVEGHEGLHEGWHEGFILRWGIPSEAEKYDVRRTK